MEAIRRPLVRSSLAGIIFAVLTVGAFIFSRFLDSSSIASLLDQNFLRKQITKTIPNDPSKPSENHHNASKKIEIPLNCSLGPTSRTRPANYYPSSKHLVEDKDLSSSSSTPPPPSCPEYFRWIYDDLLPWRETGITENMVVSANRTATFRLVILDGKAYVETYRRSFQSRDTFSLWGILQLLRRYPGKVPDLDIMFDAGDLPVIKKETFRAPQYSAPPPLFKYCSDHSSFDIVFPDWSFWGWPEINIKPWEALSEDLKEANKRMKWTDREPHAYWKGNPAVAATRRDLLKCNVSDKQDWNARVYAQDWHREIKQGFKQSVLANQCVHRYKIYIEGVGWSVSEKYILACDSVTLIVKPRYYDFFTRNLVPLKHYWPVKDYDKCKSIKYAVHWGNNHQQEAQAMGKAASNFIFNDLKMDYVYDYMFYLLSEYSKLLRYKPTIPEKAVELCSESIACTSQGLQKQYLIDSIVKGPSASDPCIMSPPYGPATLYSIIRRRDDGIKQVESWEKEYWDSQKQQNV